MNILISCSYDPPFSRTYIRFFNSNIKILGNVLVIYTQIEYITMCVCDYTTK